jgi:hypothetical protein
MSKSGIVLLAGYLAWAVAACRAGEPTERIIPVTASETVTVEAPAPEIHPEADLAATGSADCCPAHGCGGLGGWLGEHMHGCSCARRAWEWLTYRPSHCPVWCSHCTHICAPTCTPPLYTYFLWHCQAGGCGGAMGHHAPAPSVAVTPVAEGTYTEGTITQPATPAAP